MFCSLKQEFLLGESAGGGGGIKIGVPLVPDGILRQPLYKTYSLTYSFFELGSKLPVPNYGRSESPSPNGLADNAPDSS